jgi:hypothetical protein
MQGYGFGRPLIAEALAERLRAKQQVPQLGTIGSETLAGVS